jgi:hypothetical protein
VDHRFERQEPVLAATAHVMADSLPSNGGGMRTHGQSRRRSTMSSYTSNENVEPARIGTVRSARKQWGRTGTLDVPTPDGDFFRDESPEAVRS